MGFRTVIVNSCCKLESRLNYLVIRGEKEKKIYINEINTLIVQSTAVSLTAALLADLAENNVKVIFCDEKCNPQTELVAYYGAHNTSKRYKEQFMWNEQIKQELWQLIIRQKIFNQSQLLYKKGFVAESEMLGEYIGQVELSDVTNREGHAAKVYFNCLLPEGVSRRGGGFLNACLNYGYAVLLSAFNREIVSSGYLTQLGIWHCNEFNKFNLSCDLMEPFRTIVDETALNIPLNDSAFKRKMANILNYEAVMEGKNTTLDLAVRRHVKSVLYALQTDDSSAVVYPESVIIKNE